MSGRPRRRRHTYEVGVIAPGGTMTRADRNQAMEFRQGILENLAYGNKFGEYAAAPHLDSSFGSNVTKRRERAATFGSEARGAVTMQQIPEGPSSTSGHAHQLYRRGDTNVTAYFGHTVWGASKEDGSVPDATAAARAARNGAPRLRPPPFKLPDDPRYRPVKAVINASRAVDMMAKLAGVQKRAGAVEGDLLAEATRNAGGAGGGNPFAVGGGGNRFLAKFAAKARGGAAAAAAPAKLFAAAAAAPPQAEALNMHMSMHMPENQPPFGVPPPYAPQPFVPSAFAPPAPPGLLPNGQHGHVPSAARRTSATSRGSHAAAPAATTAGLRTGLAPREVAGVACGAGDSAAARALGTLCEIKWVTVLLYLVIGIKYCHSVS